MNLSKGLFILLSAGALWAQIPRVSILEFTGPQCVPCAAAETQLKQLQSEYGAGVTVIVKDVSQHPDEARALGVATLPALFINGRRLDGLVDRASLTRVIDVSLGKLIATAPVPLNLESAPILGPAGAPQITVFSDFQCPYCSSLAPVLTELTRKGEAAIRFKHFPLSFHAKAPAAHRAAWAAGQQGKFWEMHDRLFAAPSRLDPAAFTEYAQALGLDLTRFNQDTALEPPILKSDVADGERAGVEGTPSLFINGRPFLGRPTLDNLRLALKTLPPATPTGTPAEIVPTFLSGTTQSPITLEWFFDAHSELTRTSAASIRELAKDPSVRVIARHLPMAFHPGSRTTHQALVLAGQQDRFWPFLDAVLNLSAEPDTERLKSLAMRLGLNAADFSNSLDRGQVLPAVETDLRRAQTLGIRGVPTFVLNGKPLEGTPDIGALRVAIAALTGGPSQ